ncbi:hypothetical protein E2C01_021247 [Portunus trituberculatus]|uniref:Uncharacterized protein n=1 Tax=Portunus trituberculatus TaxID=210409 RepID=A0A5B7E5K4_PORTR|nr:hypothetical protein [Portunus trituberculatus]
MQLTLTLPDSSLNVTSPITHGLNTAAGGLRARQVISGDASAWGIDLREAQHLTGAS